MWRYGFFNSVGGDRTYNADDMSSIFEGLITDGVYEAVGNKMAVQPNSGMTIQIASGRGWFGGRWVNNSSPYAITLETADATLNRWCAVIVKVDTTNSVRSAVPTVKYSEYATVPVKPTMTRTDTVKEYCLAYVYIPAGATAITTTEITDTRFNSELCGWVTGLIEQLDTSTLYAQWQALFEAFLSQSAEGFDDWLNARQAEFTGWFEDLVDIIDENVETTLVNAMARNTTVTLTVAGWVNKQQSVSVIGMSATKCVVIEGVDDEYTSCGVSCTAQSTNTLTFTCSAVPRGAITVKVMYMGV